MPGLAAYRADPLWPLLVGATYSLPAHRCAMPTAPCSSSPTAPASPPKPSATRSWRSSPAKPRHVRRPFIDTPTKACAVVGEINRHRRSTRASARSCSSRWSTTRCATSSPATSARAWCWTCSAPSSSRSRRVRRQEQPPRRPLFRRRQERGVQRPHRGDQLLAGPRRRPDGAQPRTGRRHPGRRQPQRQDADLAVPGDAARHQGRQLPADPRGLRARHAAVVARTPTSASASA